MRVLLDENLPRRLRQYIEGHEVATVQEIGWAGTPDGELLRRAGERFDALVTADRSLAHQQNVAGATIGIIVVVARNTRLATLGPLVPAILAALGSITPGELVHVVERRSREYVTQALALPPPPRAQPRRRGGCW